MSIEMGSHANPQWEFGDRIRKVRRGIARLGQAEMADALGVSRQVYASWEAGRTKPSDIVATSKQIERLWPRRVTASWMLGVDSSGPPHPPNGGEWGGDPQDGAPDSKRGQSDNYSV